MFSSFNDALRKITLFLSFDLNRKNSLVLILVFTIIIILDLTIVKFIAYSGVEVDSNLNIMIFFVFSAAFTVTNVMLVSTVIKMTSRNLQKITSLRLNYFHALIIGTLASSIIIIFLIFFQIILTNEYSIDLLRAETILSHVSSIVFLYILVFFFAQWLVVRRSILMILFIVAFSLVGINLMISLVYLEFTFSSSFATEIEPSSISSFVVNLPVSYYTESLTFVFDALSLSSFLVMWIATAVLLGQYRHKLGMVRYFGLMSIPLVYYIYPMQGYFGDILLPILITVPIASSIIYVLLFSATKQVGAFLFSLAFWTTSKIVLDNQLKGYIFLSAIGTALVFGSVEITPLQYHVYPPFGLITEALTPMGTYLLLVGIFISARRISQSAEVRRQFHQSASSQLDLLNNIGVTQMEKEYEEKVKYIHKRYQSQEIEKSPQLREDEIKQILHEVLEELYNSKSNNKSDTHN
jgi:hypothetical protein